MPPVNAPASYVLVPWWVWAGFFLLVLGVLAIDNWIVDRKSHKVTLKEALIWSGIWIGLALAFGLSIAFWDAAGPRVAGKFAAGYLLELSLSVDNLFVFLIIFAHYKVPAAYHHKVLSWGIYGAMAMRAIFIGLGAAAVARWHWVLWIFGAFLIYTGIKLMLHKEEATEPGDSPILKAAHRVFNVTKDYVEDRFFLRRAGKLWVTPLFVIVLIVEVSDVIFAVDSIPAVFGISSDPFIVYTSNIFAILGLRSMFFALEGVMHMFRFLKVGLSVILTLIGVKLLALHWLEARYGFHAGEFWVLGAIVAILVASVAASVLIPAPKPASKAKPRMKARKR